MVTTILFFNDSGENAMNPLKADQLHRIVIYSDDLVF